MYSRVYELAGVFFLTLVVLIRAQGGGVLTQDDDGMSGTIQFGGPEDLNDEMMQSPFVPHQRDIQCDACKAIAYQMWVHFEDFNKKRRSLKYNIPESELIELMEELCSNIKTWEGYGMKTIKKITRLSGPGLDTSDTPGVTASGGKWPGRLRDMCESYAGEVGETTIYKVYRHRPSDASALTDYLCRSTGGKDTMRNKCAHEGGRKTSRSGGEL